MHKTLSVGALLEVKMSKKCTPLWRDAHLEVKMLKTPGFGPLLEVEMSKVHAVVARSTFCHFESKCSNYHMLMLGPLFDDSSAIPRRKSEPRCGAKHIWK